MFGPMDVEYLADAFATDKPTSALLAIVTKATSVEVTADAAIVGSGTSATSVAITTIQLEAAARTTAIAVDEPR
ncbi:hypothetical protein GUJ93_ZPchr0010g7459 [Zizania palustris]|uniref:Uncharacterized protein n=1 Tax=Zizania palustris TaxID=103762 RepID=A0A8J5WHW0_ZIZPA|nr:hypothetical protein GUJ93_ZPchr0010g7459 [Zizania palustris]